MIARIREASRVQWYKPFNLDMWLQKRNTLYLVEGISPGFYGAFVGGDCCK